MPLRYDLILCLATTVGGCFAHGSSRVAPRRAEGRASTILFMGVELPEPGAVIGAHFAGTGYEVRQANYQLTEAVRERWSVAERDRGEALMRGAGFRVRGIGPASSDALQLLGVQYGLLGRVTDLAVRSTGSSPLRVDVQVEVAWELLDLAGGSAVFGHQVHGGAHVDGTLDSAVARALDDDLARLIADTLFLRALEIQRADPDAGIGTRSSRVVPERDTIVVADSDLNPSHEASVVARMSTGIATLLVQDHAVGTAVILTRDGLALAVGRSVRSVRRLRVRLFSGVERPARVVRSHAGLDVALIQIACGEPCPTVDWDAPEGVDPATGFAAIGAPPTEDVLVEAVFGQVGGRWGLSNGVTLEGISGKAAGGWPLALTSSGKVFALVSSRPGRERMSAVLLSEVLRALRVRAPEARAR